MAITENSFTGPELTAALAANKDLMPVLRGVLTDQKITVRDEAEETAFKTNFETEVVKRKTSEYATQLEKDVLELTGIAKTGPTEKYYDYFKRATTEKLASVATLEKELGLLKDKHNPSEADKLRIKQLEDGLEAKNKEWGEKLAAKEKEVHTLRVGNEIKAAIAKLRTQYKADLPAGVLEIVEKNAEQALLAVAEVQEDGKVTFKGPDGKVIVNTANYQPETADVLIKGYLKDVIDPGKQQAGAGTGPESQGGAGGGAGAGGAGGAGGQGGAGGAKQKITALPADVNSKTKLTEHMLKLGYTSDDPDFTKDFEQFGASLPIR